MSTSAADWWRQATVYQIYPRSFADANGDGIGDLKGITSKIDYLNRLGIDAVWLSPFFPSPLKDGGYDVSDYRNVDPNIGTLADFDEMMAAFKQVDIKVIIDIVPNHSGHEHEWFKAALAASTGSAERARYHFQDGKGENKSEPPNDWDCLFGGSAWEPVGDGQYYFHMFDSSQPDLNWDNEEVRQDFLRTLRFWADRGVSGFRVDVAMAMAKDLSQPFVSKGELARLETLVQVDGKPANFHPFWDRDDTLEIFREWRKIFNEYDPPLTAVGEIAVSQDRVGVYASPDGLGQAFAFDILKESYHAESYIKTIKKLYDTARSTGSTTTWVLSNHDVIRHATRYGIPEAANPTDKPFETNDKMCNDFLISGGQGYDQLLGLKRARAATLMMLGLPGSSYMYQGEELGLPEVIDIPANQRQDPIFIREKGQKIGRDGCRVPIPWAKAGSSCGFSPENAAEPHLPVPAWYGDFSAEASETEKDSTLNMYRQAMALRRKLQGAETMEWLEERSGIVYYGRPGGWDILMNVACKEGVNVPDGRVLMSSGPLEGSVVPINTTVWIQRA